MHNSKETREKNYDWHHFNLTFVTVFPQTSAHALIIALLRINTHPLDHNVKKVPPFSLFKLEEMQGKLVSLTTLFTIFYASESVQENSIFSIESVQVISISICMLFFKFFFCDYCLHKEAKLQTKSNLRVNLRLRG